MPSFCVWSSERGGERSQSHCFYPSSLLSMLLKNSSIMLCFVSSCAGGGRFILKLLTTVKMKFISMFPIVTEEILCDTFFLRQLWLSTANTLKSGGITFIGNELRAKFNNHGNRQNNIASLICEKRLLILIAWVRRKKKTNRHVSCVELHRKQRNLIFRLSAKKKSSTIQLQILFCNEDKIDW